MPTLEIDCTSAGLPEGIRVAPCRRFEGWSLEATRSWNAGDVVYLHPVRLLSEDVEVRLVTAFGVRRCTFAEYGLELLPSSLGFLAPELLERLANHCGLPAADHEALFAALTRGGRQRFLNLGFEELVNHSNEPNCAADLVVELDLSGPEPRGRGQLRALKRIAPGDELTVDYRTFSGPWEPPADWVA